VGFPLPVASVSEPVCAFRTAAVNASEEEKSAWRAQVDDDITTSGSRPELSGVSHSREGCDAGLGDLAILLGLDA
jgi:hypothetical protein